METNHSNRYGQPPGRTLPCLLLLLLMLLPTANSCSSRSVAIYRQTRESQYSTTVSSDGWGNSQAPNTGDSRADGSTAEPLPQAEARVGGPPAEPLPRAEARVGGPFLIPDDDVGDDVRPVLISDVEAVAAGFGTSEPETYIGELERDVEESLYPSEDERRRRKMDDVLSVYGAGRPFRPRCANCLLRTHGGVRQLTPAPPMDASRNREMARKQRQISQDESPYNYVIEVLHNVTEERLPAAPPIRDEHGNLRRLVKEEDVLRKVDIRIEEAWDKEAFEHRRWHNWNWLREHYGGERHSQIAGNNVIQLGFEPTLSHMMAEMLRSGQTTPDEIYAALDALVKRSKPLHGDKRVVEDKSRAVDASAAVGDKNDKNVPPSEIRDVASIDSEPGRASLSSRTKSHQRLSHRGSIRWFPGGDPRPSASIQAWDRHKRLMSEFENPEAEHQNKESEDPNLDHEFRSPEDDFKNQGEQLGRSGTSSSDGWTSTARQSLREYGDRIEPHLRSERRTTSGEHEEKQLRHGNDHRKGRSGLRRWFWRGRVGGNANRRNRRPFQRRMTHRRSVRRNLKRTVKDIPRGFNVAVQEDRTLY